MPSGRRRVTVWYKVVMRGGSLGGLHRGVRYSVTEPVGNGRTIHRYGVPRAEKPASNNARNVASTAVTTGTVARKACVNVAVGTYRQCEGRKGA